MKGNRKPREMRRKPRNMWRNVKKPAYFGTSANPSGTNTVQTRSANSESAFVRSANSSEQKKAIRIHGGPAIRTQPTTKEQNAVSEYVLDVQ